MLKNNLTKNEFLNNAINALSRLGYDDTANSNIYQIFNALINEDHFDAINEVIRSLNFSTMQLDELDALFGELFGIKRMTNVFTGDRKHFVFLFGKTSNSPSVYFKVGARFIYAGRQFVVAESKKLLASNMSREEIIVCNEIVANWNFDYPYTSGALQIDGKENIEVVDLQPNQVNDFLQQHLSFIRMDESDNSNAESDTEYRIRSGKILSGFGYNNEEIIKKKIMSIYGVVGISEKRYDFATDFYIIPADITLLNDIITAAKEICDYFKVSKINIRKPPAVRISVSGVLNQFSQNHTPELKALIENYIKDLKNNGYIFNRDNFENMLYDFGNSKSNSFILKEDEIEIKYEVYSENSYIDNSNAVPVVSKSIEENSSIKFNNTIFVPGTIL